MLHFKFHTWGTHVSDQLVKIKEKKLLLSCTRLQMCIHPGENTKDVCLFTALQCSAGTSHSPSDDKNINVYTHIKKKKNITSGARYSGVPQKVFMVAASVMPSLQSPKSVILIWPSLSSIKFSNWKEIKISLSLCDTLLTGWTLFVHCGVKLVITLKRKAVRDE